MEYPAFYLEIDTSALGHFDDDQLFSFCAANPSLNIERDENKHIIIMAPTSADVGRRNFRISGFLFAWVEQSGLGVAFDSSTGFLLPNNAMRSPDASWMTQARWERATPEQRSKFFPGAPDFVIELRSPTDRLADQHKKMDEWIANGVRLGWLIDPVEQISYVYTPGAAPVVVKGFDQTLSGRDVLPGFVLSLAAIR